MFDLSNKIAVVTGGGSGIGQAIALTFARQSARVFVLELLPEKADDTLRLIEAEGGQAQALTCNVANAESVRGAMQQVADLAGHIDLLVNNAGISHIGTVESTSEADFDRVFAVNVRGVFLCMQAAIPHMKKQGGSIINLASVASVVGLADRFAYSMSKGAALLMTLSAAKDLLPFGIRVNAISPARVHTPFVDQFLTQHYPGQEADMFAKLAATQPIGRMGKPEEVAALALYLAADESAFVTGTNFPIDGGFISLNT
jgi:NAD(P)-dependent dehydrogenase (short-subunit alcohol dehydrogenase family)